MKKRAQVKIPPGPRKPGFSPMAAPQRRLIFITKRWNTGWVRGDGSSIEKYTAYARLSDGSVIETTEEMHYATGEREGILERAVTGRSTDRDLAKVRALRDERMRKQQECHAFIDRDFAGGTPPEPVT
jgi:hypothetical protein